MPKIIFCYQQIGRTMLSIIIQNTQLTANTNPIHEYATFHEFSSYHIEENNIFININSPATLQNLSITCNTNHKVILNIQNNIHSLTIINAHRIYLQNIQDIYELNN